jgi:integrase
LAKELVEWREHLSKEGRYRSPDAFLFPGRFGGPMDSSNYRHRVLHKLIGELELPKLTFPVTRRTIATLGKTKGDVKDIQGMMRHTKASTTTDVHMQSLEPEVRSPINSIYAELMGDGTHGHSSPGANRSQDTFSTHAVAMRLQNAGASSTG